ncbi:MAG: DUF4878 domain-containing protein [Bacteroidales bacterium]|nr:DUF4878 domain-containing protein [Bacteroidales bacterium]
MKTLKRMFIIRAAVVCAIALVVVLVIALRGNSSSQTKADGPAQVVEAFNRAITAGDFEKAASLCDTISMKNYLESYKEAWQVINMEDSTVLAIASEILTGAVLNIEEVLNEDGKKLVVYTLEADGHSKTRQARLKKEEGEWRIEAVTDRI